MKKLVTLLAALALLCGAAHAEAGPVNPWTDTTAEALMEALGLALGVPEGATNVAWRVLEEAQLGEVHFTWEGEDYTARIMPAEAFEDISGLHYSWDRKTDCVVGRCQGVCRRGRGGEDTVDLCLWYDELTGLMYSVSVADRDLDGFDILAVAERLYVPMQTE